MARWPCICGADWPSCPHGARRWRGHPGIVRPFDQWCSERLPTGKAGTVKMDADALIRGYDPEGTDPRGAVLGIEVKGFSETLSYAERLTLEAAKDRKSVV